MKMHGSGGDPEDAVEHDQSYYDSKSLWNTSDPTTTTWNNALTAAKHIKNALQRYLVYHLLLHALAPRLPALAPACGAPADAALARLAPGSVDAAYLSVNAAQLLESPAFRAALKPGAAVTAEKARLVVPLTDQEKRTFDGKVRDLAKAHGFAEAHDDADAVRFAFAAAAE